MEVVGRSFPNLAILVGLLWALSVSVRECDGQLEQLDQINTAIFNLISTIVGIVKIKKKEPIIIPIKKKEIKTVYIPVRTMNICLPVTEPVLDEHGRHSGKVRQMGVNCIKKGPIYLNVFKDKKKEMTKKEIKEEKKKMKLKKKLKKMTKKMKKHEDVHDEYEKGHGHQDGDMHTYEVVKDFIGKLNNKNHRRRRRNDLLTAGDSIEIEHSNYDSQIYRYTIRGQ